MVWREKEKGRERDFIHLRSCRRVLKRSAVANLRTERRLVEGLKDENVTGNLG